MADFLRLDAHLLEAARAASDDLRPTRRADLARWVGALSSTQLRKLATGLLEGSDPALRLEALRRPRRAARRTARRPR